MHNNYIDEKNFRNNIKRIISETKLNKNNKPNIKKINNPKINLINKLNCQETNLINDSQPSGIVWEATDNNTKYNNNLHKTSNYIGKKELMLANSFLEARYKDHPKDILNKLSIQEVNNLNTVNKLEWKNHITAIDNGEMSAKDLVLMYLTTKNVFNNNIIEEKSLPSFIPQDNKILKEVNTDNLLLAALEVNNAAKKNNIEEVEKRNITEVAKNLSIAMGHVTSNLMEYIDNKDLPNKLNEKKQKRLETLQTIMDSSNNKNYDVNLGKAVLDAVKIENELTNTNIEIKNQNKTIDKYTIGKSMVSSVITTYISSYIAPHAATSLALAKGIVLSTIGLPALCFIGGAGLAIGIGITLVNKAKRLLFS